MMMMMMLIMTSFAEPQPLLSLMRKKITLVFSDRTLSIVIYAV